MSRTRRPILPIVLVLGLAFTALVSPTGAAAVTPDRIAGDDRVGTSIALSRTVFGAADVAVLASAGSFADALTATPLAAEYDAPVLLTGRDRLDPRVGAELDRLGVRRVLVIGGEAALGRSVEAALDRAVDDVERIAGGNRFDTARVIAELLRDRWRAGGDVDAGRRAIVALGGRPDGGGWPDALAAGVLAGTDRRPILLVTPTLVPRETRRALDTLRVDDVVVAGGTAAVSRGVVSDLGVAGVQRLGGANRFATATRLADAAVAAGASPASVTAVTGATYADALAAGAAALRRGGVLLLVDREDLDRSPAARDWLRARRGTLTSITVAGGPAAVAEPVLGQLDWATGGFRPPRLRLERVYTTPAGAARGDVPMGLTALDGDPRRFVWRRHGRILQLDGAGTHLFLDLTRLTRADGERGLLGVAPHPDHARNGRVFVHYSRRSDGATVLAEYRRRDARSADPGSGRVLLVVGQPASNHNGGTVTFAPDGALLLFLGDGGGAGGPANAQNVDTLLGGVLRLDVSTPGVARPAAGNPYLGRRGDDRLWAHGLRNPYRASVDPPTGTLWIADVGQNHREEVNAVPVGAGGLDYGWPVLEGTRCYPSGGACNRAGFTPPVFEYGHGEGCSVTGGHVYRGRVGMLRGHYFFGDFCAGTVRSFRLVDGAATELRDWTGELGFRGQVFSFGRDGAGEIYVVSPSGVDRLVAG